MGSFVAHALVIYVKTIFMLPKTKISEGPLGYL